MNAFGKNITALSWLILAVAVSACNGGGTSTLPPGNTEGGSTGGGGTPPSTGTPFTVSGVARFHSPPALDNVTEGGVRLGYSVLVAKPIRRAIVQALRSTSIVAETITNDHGEFSLSVPAGTGVKLRVLAKTVTQANLPDGIGPDYCRSAAWELRVVDNTRSKGVYVLDGATQYSSNADGITLDAALAHNGSRYTDRAAAPFAILDVAVSAMELVCSAKPDTQFPKLFINWSPENIDDDGETELGEIGTTHYTTEDGIANIYVLGQEDVDTDEFDDHVIAHEFGHYLEDKLFRSDSRGGPHGSGQALDPRLAFSEGWGNALSAMTFNDPVYVDTNGEFQGDGFAINIAAAPRGDDRGVYSETSAQYLLWSLYENRDSAARSGRFDRIHSILRNAQRLTYAFTTLQSFVAFYNETFGGSAESVGWLWETALDTPYNSLCRGACNGVFDTGDPYDTDNDIGKYYAYRRYYELGSGLRFPAEFWALYRVLAGGVNTPTAHDQVEWARYSYPLNKFGNSRWYVYVPNSSGTKRITVSRLNGGSLSCSADYLDMYVYLAGTLVVADDSTGGCPSVSFSAAYGKTYIVEIAGYDGEPGSWNIEVVQ